MWHRYLLPRGEADIFFPTDFGLLQRLAGAAVVGRGAPAGEESGAGAPGGGGGGRRGRVLTNREMMREYADVARARALSGFNPLVDDFSNTRVFLT